MPGHNQGGDHFGAAREARLLAAHADARRTATRIGQECLGRVRRMADEKRRDWLAGKADQEDVTALEWAETALRDLVRCGAEPAERAVQHVPGVCEDTGCAECYTQPEEEAERKRRACPACDGGGTVDDIGCSMPCPRCGGTGVTGACFKDDGEEFDEYVDYAVKDIVGPEAPADSSRTVAGHTGGKVR